MPHLSFFQSTKKEVNANSRLKKTVYPSLETAWVKKSFKTPWIDCGTVYQALALVIADTILGSPFSASQPGIAKLLEAFFVRFPESLPAKPSTPFNDFKTLLKIPTLNQQLITQLADILYNMTIEGLIQHPTRYHEFSLPSEKREYPAHWIATSAPAILADYLGLSIKVSTVASGKSFHATMVYEPPNAYKRTLHLRVRHGHYSAKLVHHDLFSSMPAAKQIPEPNAQVFAKLTSKLNVEIEATLKKFKSVYKRLSHMVDAGDLTKEFLLQLYLQNLSFNRLHAGTQAFFDSIHIEEAEHSTHMIPELVDAIARMICLGEIDESLVFTQIEQLEENGVVIVPEDETVGYAPSCR